MGGFAQRIGVGAAGAAAAALLVALPAPVLAATGPCGGVTLGEAASILEVAPEDVVGPSVDKVMTCTFRIRDRPFITLSFNLYVASSAAAAQRDLVRVKTSLVKMSPVVPVAGLGDEAYRASGTKVMRLVVRKGEVWFDIGTPRAADEQRRVAQIILAHVK